MGNGGRQSHVSCVSTDVVGVREELDLSLYLIYAKQPNGKFVLVDTALKGTANSHPTTYIRCLPTSTRTLSRVSGTSTYSALR